MARRYPDLPVFGIGAVVFKDDAVLMVRRLRPPGAGTWTLPGGTQDLGETVEDCVKREVMEETGIAITVDPDPLQYVDLLFPDDSGRLEYHYTVLNFVCRWRAGTPKAESDAADATWIPFIRALDLTAEPTVLAAIDKGARRLGLA